MIGKLLKKFMAWWHAEDVKLSAQQDRMLQLYRDRVVKLEDLSQEEIDRLHAINLRRGTLFMAGIAIGLIVAGIAIWVS